MAERRGESYDQFRYSNRDRTEGDTEEERRGREESYARLRRENERLKKSVQYWKGQTKTTKENTINRKNVEKFARTLLKDYESQAEAAGVTEKLNALGDYLVSAEQVMVERIYQYGFKYFKMGYASAFSWILFTIIMICTAIQMRGQKRWVNYDS